MKNAIKWYFKWIFYLNYFMLIYISLLLHTHFNLAYFIYVYFVFGLFIFFFFHSKMLKPSQNLISPGWIKSSDSEQQISLHEFDNSEHRKCVLKCDLTLLDTIRPSCQSTIFWTFHDKTKRKLYGRQTVTASSIWCVWYTRKLTRHQYKVILAF